MNKNIKSEARMQADIFTTIKPGFHSNAINRLRLNGNRALVYELQAYVTVNGSPSFQILQLK